MPDPFGGWLRGFLYSQFMVSIPYPKSDFSNQTVIITGSNTGLGLEAARHVVRLGAAKVILGVRTVSKGEDAAADIIRSCKVKAPVVEVWQLDMSLPESIKAFAERAKGLDRLDAALLNAGMMSHSYVAFDGVEGQVAVNDIGTTLLTLLLLPKLRQSAATTGQRGRLSIVGSDTMYLADINELETEGSILEKLNSEANAKGGNSRYSLSKQLILYSIRELAARSPVSDKSNVIIDVMTPGLCHSSLMREEHGAVVKVIISMLMNLIARTTEVGGRTLVHSIEPKLPVGAHGSFLMDVKVAHLGSNVESDQGKRLAEKWNKELFAEVERLAPGSTKI